ncbi:hypothetical protein MRX96_042712 [Rhipicephalus microplus]
MKSNIDGDTYETRPSRLWSASELRSVCGVRCFFSSYSARLLLAGGADSGRTSRWKLRRKNLCAVRPEP